MGRLDKRSRRMNTQRMKTLRTVTDIVKAFGGEDALAHLMLGTPLPGSKNGKRKKNGDVNMILNWIALNYIPPGWHYRLHLAAEAKGCRIDPRALNVPVRGFEGVKVTRAA